RAGPADAIMGVAASLEPVRAIKARGVPARDVMVLFTDGEEAGLLGANHFFRRDPLAKRVGLVFKLEARGGGGRARWRRTTSSAAIRWRSAWAWSSTWRRAGPAAGPRCSRRALTTANRSTS